MVSSKRTNTHQSKTVLANGGCHDQNEINWKIYFENLVLFAWKDAESNNSDEKKDISIKKKLICLYTESHPNICFSRVWSTSFAMFNIFSDRI